MSAKGVPSCPQLAASLSIIPVARCYRVLCKTGLEPDGGNALGMSGCSDAGLGPVGRISDMLRHRPQPDLGQDVPPHLLSPLQVTVRGRQRRA